MKTPPPVRQTRRGQVRDAQMNSTASSNGTFPQDARGAAEVYLRKGLAPIPLPHRSKNPGYQGWESLRVTPDTLDQHFPPGQSLTVGVLNGAPSSNNTDVDIDCPEALCIADRFLPHTGWEFGKRSTPRAHRQYRTDVPLDAAQLEFTDIDE